MNAGWTQKKLNIKVRQQTKTLEENVSTLKTEDAQLKTASSDKEGELQAAKNLQYSQVSQQEAKLKLKSSSKISGTQSSPSPANIAPNKSVESNVSTRGRRLVLRASKPSTTTNPITLPIVNPICRDQISVSISPFTSSLMTRPGIKRWREEAEVPTTSISDPHGKRNKVVALPPLGSQQPTHWQPYVKLGE